MLNKIMNRLGLVLIGLVCLNSCKKDDDSITTTINQIYNYATAYEYMDAIYTELATQNLFSDAFLFLPVLYSDECEYIGSSNSGWQQASNFNLSPDNTLLNETFLDFYVINSSLNYYFANVDTVQDQSLTDNVRKGLRAEGQALRAVLYFYLSNFWGEVPLVTDVESSIADSLQEGATAQELFDQIESDLLYAEENFQYLTIHNTNQRLNVWGVKALLARLYLYNGEWALARQYAEDVINNSGITLETTVSGIYSLSGSEHIWVLPESLDDEAVAIYFLQGFANGQHVVVPRENDFFEAGDKRRNVALSQPGTTILKYDDAFGNSDPLYMIRLSEMYLIAAEAACRASSDFDGAEDYINELRTRAGLADVELTAGNFEDVILQERRAELCYEGAHRWFDLKRTGKDVDELEEYGYAATDDLWPFTTPFLEIFKSIEQNPGY